MLKNTTRSVTEEGKLCKLSVWNSQSRAVKLVGHDLNMVCCRSWFKGFLFSSAVLLTDKGTANNVTTYITL